ncbi:MAG: acyl carrier protein [Chloroflexota bacterium]
MQPENKELIDNVRQAIAEVLEVNIDEITPEITFGDIPQWDSMGHMEVMLALEQRFGVAVNADTIGELVSLAKIVEHIAKNDNA